MCYKVFLYLSWIFSCICATAAQQSYQLHHPQSEAHNSRCYDDRRRPQKCVPEFVNAAFNVLVEATNTCGDPPLEYCFQTGATGATKSCEICDARDPSRSHPADYLTDFNNNDNTTWWQSTTMREGVQFPNVVNLTLSLGKAFDITYIRLKFQTSRPESFAIHKRTQENGVWIPYQYYSATCRETYSLSEDNYLRRGDETRALCTSEFSDISPLVGGNVAFSTLDGRPTAVDESNALQEWVTATDIRISLQRLNTFGDEIFGDPNVLKSYYYAISDLAVGGRCKCNGHASECVRSTGQGLEERLVCRCEHNTAGVDCQECLPFYQDQPWRRATTENAHECQPCNCNGLSHRCYFDLEQYRRTGHGGHCVDCAGNTDGPHCETCKSNHYHRPGDLSRHCLPCNCHEKGAYKSQCNDTGVCECRPGVAGAKCDRCEVNFYDFTDRGCRPCGCTVAGSVNNIPSCTSDKGQCSCKVQVEGQNCDKCRPGFFNLEENNPYGCLSCFCFGHSSICSSATDYSRTSISTDFSNGVGGWTAVSLNGRNVTLEILPTGPNGLGIRQHGADPIYVFAPESYLGDRRFSYDQNLTFALRLSQDGARASIQDIVIEGRGMESETLKISVPIFAQGNPMPNRAKQTYKFRLHEQKEYGWSPRLSSFEFQRLLSNVTSIRIRTTYVTDGTGYVDNISLGSASPISDFVTKGVGQLASHVETCQCPNGYVGQFCEDCAPGFRRSVSGGDVFATCVPCNCHNHSDTCDRKTGRCLCQHNTAGDSCEKCAPGFYGTPQNGKPDACQPCPCPRNGPCALLNDKDVVCTGCATGYAGLRCELCADGYFGDPEGKHGPATDCQPCNCNSNIDLNAVGNCHPLTGKCLKCIHNTTGDSCEQCLAGYYGDALKKTCRLCDCYPPGTEPSSGNVLDCDKSSGQCPCKPNVIGRKCNEAPIGYWNLISGEGGQRCDCDPKGSYNRSCHLMTGQCFCRDGVTGRQCDRCLPYHYGFSATGCRPCNCDGIGALSLQCDANTGQCQCQKGVVGKQCNRCEENRYNISLGCLECDVCYGLVKESADSYRTKLRKLEAALDSVANTAVEVEDLAGFKNRMDSLAQQISTLENMASTAIGTQVTAADSANLISRLDEITKRISTIEQKLHNMSTLIESGRMFANDASYVVAEGEKLAKRCFDALASARSYLENEARDAFLSAKDASSRFGQTSNKMSEIARDSRRLADEHVAAAQGIIELADKSLNSSRDALRILADTVARKNNNSHILDELRREQSLLQSLQTRVQNLASKAKEDADKAYAEALEIYTQASGITVPVINVSSLLMQAQDIDQGSQQIANSSSNLLSGNAALLDMISAEQKRAEIALNTSKSLQQDTDAMVADMDKAKDDAEKAIRKAENILKEAKETLETLQGFNAVADQSKAKAKTAIAEVPTIENGITEAQRKNDEATVALNAAERDASQAKNIALQAQKTAEEASKTAGKIREDSNQAKIFASGLRDKAGILAGDVNRANTEFEGLVTEAKADEAAVKETTEKTGELTRKVEQAKIKVDQAWDNVEDIILQLADVDDIQPGQLDELELRLNAIEAQLGQTNLAPRLQNLTNLRQTQQRVINDYTLELDRLKKEVVTIEAIRNSLPDKCFNQERLEQ
ncbi:laminin subunit gamma-1-like isoform X2 [Paramacrobiotus metropolitanus]|nr:laminin subunit gamma-1-like isoform X2 [Paramacrobiotus metropolitanus]